MEITSKVINAGSYSIFIGDAVLADLNKFIQFKKYNKSNIFILVDEHTLKNCLPVLIKEVKGLKDAEIIEVENGEGQNR